VIVSVKNGKCRFALIALICQDCVKSNNNFKAGIAAKSVLTKKIEKNSAKSRSNDGRVEAKPNGSLQQTAKIKSGNSCGSRSNCGFFGKQSFVMVEQNFFAVVVG
jgi:hypothetical protein